MIYCLQYQRQHYATTLLTNGILLTKCEPRVPADMKTVRLYLDLA